MISSSIWSFDSEFWTPENQIHHFHILVLSLNYYKFFSTQNPFFRFTTQLQIKSQKSHRNYYWQFHDEFNSFTMGHESWKCNFSLKMQFFVKNVKKIVLFIKSILNLIKHVKYCIVVIFSVRKIQYKLIKTIYRLKISIEQYLHFLIQENFHFFLDFFFSF